MASQLERERVADSTAHYHERAYLRCMVTLINPPRALSEAQCDEIARRADYHWREIEAAEVRLVAIQLEGFEVESLRRLCRRAA